MAGLLETGIYCGDADQLSAEERTLEHPLSDQFEVIDDPMFAPRVEGATVKALRSMDPFEQAHARQLATEQVVRAAGFQDYQARAFQLGENEPTEVIREFVEQFGWERSEDNESRRTAKRQLDDAILAYIDRAVTVAPDEFWRLDQFLLDKNDYRIQQLLDVADRNDNFTLALQALGVPTELIDHTPWGGNKEDRQAQITRAVSEKLSVEGAPRELGKLSAEATEHYLKLVRVQLSNDQRRAIERIIEEKFAPIETPHDSNEEERYLNGYKPLEAKPIARQLTTEQKKLIGLVATRT